MWSYFQKVCFNALVLVLIVADTFFKKIDIKISNLLIEGEKEKKIT